MCSLSRSLALACALAALALPATAQSADSPELTLDEAMRLAEAAHSSVRLRQAESAAADAARRDAAALLAHNPELSTERTRRRLNNPSGQATEWSIGIAQPFETGGQQSRRRQVAAAALQAAQAEVDVARRDVRADAALRFHAVLAAQRHVQLEQRSLDLFAESADTVERRRSAGEDTRLDSNVALIETERSRNALAQARENLLDARSDLGTALQLAPKTLPSVRGELASLAGDGLPYSLDDLLAAMRAQPTRTVFAARAAQAHAQLAVEQRNRYPDVTVGLSVGREGFSDGRERVTMLTLSVPLPLFKRNEEAIGRATADATKIEIEREIALRNSEAQVHRLWSRLSSQRLRVQRLEQAMLSASADNQQLAIKSRRAGQIGALEQLLINRQALDAERDFNDALAAFHTTRIEMEHAAGWPQQGVNP